jgi:hypothetical protein
LRQRRLPVFGFQEPRLSSADCFTPSSRMTLARLHADSRFPQPSAEHRVLLPGPRAASSTICRSDSCEPTRPIATDSAPMTRPAKLARHLPARAAT